MSTQFFVKAKEAAVAWKLGWLRVFIYSSMLFLGSIVALTENWSDNYLTQLHIPTAFFALAIVLAKSYNIAIVGVIAFLDNTIQKLKEELKNKQDEKSSDIIATP